MVTCPECDRPVPPFTEGCSLCAAAQELDESAKRLDSLEFSTSCPRSRCKGRVPVPLSAAVNSAFRSFPLATATCNTCGHTFGCLAGEVRSQKGYVLERGSPLKEWTLRFSPPGSPDQEALMRFIGPREIEAKSRDPFLVLFTRPDRQSDIVQFSNMKVGVTWDTGAAHAAGGCCAIGLAALVLAASGCLFWLLY